MNSGRTVGSFFVRRLIVQRGEIRRMFQGHPDCDPETFCFCLGSSSTQKKKKKDSVLISVFPLFHNTL